MNNPARKKCYQEIREATMRLTARYTEQHPEWAGDDRAQVGMEWTVQLFKDIFTVLDKYELKERKQ